LMDIIRGINEIPGRLQRAFVTIGNFDGIHLGHRYIFTKMIDEARQVGCKTIVISFDPHPKMVLYPDRRPFYLISTQEEKIGMLAGIGIDAYLILPFSLEYAQTTAEEFIEDLLWKRLRIRKIIIGHDYTFGRGGQGNEALLTEEGKRLGFDVEAMNAFRINNEIVSSTKIREAILKGDVDFAAALLGRPYNISGLVVPGDKRGIELGFPTANVEANKELLPARGVYAVHCILKEKSLNGVLNIGYKPTFSGGRLTIEVHILDFDGDIYGEFLDVLFIQRLRDEIKFAGPGELIAQIHQDILNVRRLLKARD